MTRAWWPSLLWFSLILLVQISFIASLPWPLKTIPLLLAFSILRVQHQAVLADAWWIVGGGVVIDLLGISARPFPILSISSLVIAVGVVVLTRSVFSTRSWYGLMLCGVSACVILALSESILLFLSTLTASDVVDWAAWGRATIWQSVFTMLLLMAAFSISLSLRGFGRRSRVRKP